MAPGGLGHPPPASQAARRKQFFRAGALKIFLQI
jgi:hypothetical protein